MYRFKTFAKFPHFREKNINSKSKDFENDSSKLVKKIPSKILKPPHHDRNKTEYYKNYKFFLPKLFLR